MTDPRSSQNPLPLDDITVLDLSRMLPGAVLDRQLLDLGGRVIKVEEPGAGDPMRLAPPLVGGVGLGFATFERGAESVCLDLRDPGDAERLRRLMEHVDVVVESFRPETLERWGINPGAVREAKPALIWCSLSSYGLGDGVGGRIGHDLNFAGETGALRLMAREGVPQLQLADIGGALLATSAILAALLLRHRSGVGAMLDQPLAVAPLPFVTWAIADAAAGELGISRTLLSGRAPCVGVYRCSDGVEITIAAIEPKFWAKLVELLELPEVAFAGYDVGEEGERAAARIAELLGERPSDHWLELARAHGLPVAAVQSPEQVLEDPFIEALGLFEQTPMPDGVSRRGVGPYLRSIGRTPERPAPKLGEHTEKVLLEFGIG
jgi:crotonobetainyl-CoA:carnitine CoA-transferase CaiB-like acyl-CoA transferase